VLLRISHTTSLVAFIFYFFYCRRGRFRGIYLSASLSPPPPFVFCSLRVPPSSSSRRGMHPNASPSSVHVAFMNSLTVRVLPDRATPSTETPQNPSSRFLAPPSASGAVPNPLSPLRFQCPRLPPLPSIFVSLSSQDSRRVGMHGRMPLDSNVCLTFFLVSAPVFFYAANRPNSDFTP